MVARCICRRVIREAIGATTLGFNPTTLRPWLADNECDELLNRAECRFDGGDCTRTSGEHRSLCSERMMDLYPICCGKC